MVHPIKELFKVEAVKVTMAPVRRKTLFQKGKRGMTSGGKKASVTLPKGTQIEF